MAFTPALFQKKYSLSKWFHCFICKASHYILIEDPGMNLSRVCGDDDDGGWKMAVGVGGSYGVEPESRQPGKWQWGWKEEEEPR